MRHIITLSTTALTALAIVIATPAPQAAACGGFFCAQVPVDQRGEQILFGVDDGTVTAHIAIAYAGDAKDFSWVVPVPSTPELGVGSQSVFNTLNARTRPRFNINWNWDELYSCGGGCAFAADADSDGPPSPSGGGEVEVVLSQEVGPYEAKVIESSDPQALVDWLNAEGFDQPPEALPLITHYVEQGMGFLALKLANDADTGDIQPITLKFQEENACVPLVLTRIAAMPDMPVLVYIASEHRAVPTNWLHVEINERKIDWLGNGQNYADVLNQAIDEASGRAFVTERAGSSDILDDAFYRDGAYDMTALAGITDPSDLLDALLSGGFPRDATMQSLLRKFIPMPQSLVDDGLDERSFYNNIGAYEDALGADFAVDSDAFLADLDAKIVQPLKDAQALVDRHPYLTRLYTTVSPDEMTRDPIFQQNPDLGDVDNAHVAEGSVACASGGDTEITLTFESGEVCGLTIGKDDAQDFMCWGFNGGGGQQLPLCDEAATEPAAERITLMQPAGPPQVVAPEDVSSVDQQLGFVLPGVVPSAPGNGTPAGTPSGLPGTVDRPGGTDTGDSGDGACTSGGGATPWWLALAAVGLLVVRRRRTTTA